MSSTSNSKAIKISYTMSPPLDLPIDVSLPVSKSHVFTVPSASPPSQSPTVDTTPNAAATDPTPTSNSNTSESVPVSQNHAEKVYYKALLATLGEAKQTVGEELTSWRDVIGKREGVVSKPEDEEDEDADGEEEEE